MCLVVCPKPPCKMIRDITHNKKDRKESAMTIVESDVELYTIHQGPGESLDEYYMIFKAQVDTIDAHGCNAGYHPMVYALHLAALLKKEETTKEAYDAMNEETKKPIQSEAMKTAKEAYLACLFILMAGEERYGGVKTALGDNYLLGKQKYPQDLLAAKRLLADFKGTPGKARKATEAADEQGVAFAEGGREQSISLPATAMAGSARAGGESARTSPRITGPRWPRSMRPGTSAAATTTTTKTRAKRAPSTSPQAQGRMVAATRAGTRPPRPRTVHSASKLTKDMTNGEILRLTGHIHTTIGMSEVDGEIYEEDSSWDGYVLANVGVGFCQVQGKTTVKDTVVNEEWLVQGRRGTNPLKVKTKKAAKSQKVASSSLKECDAALVQRHEEKPAWVLESCLRGKNELKVSDGQRVRIKECDKESKTKPAPIKMGNTALPLKNKVKEACAKLLNKVVPKSKALEDKARSTKSSPEGDDLKRGEGCILAQNLTPEGEAQNGP